ncbi:hypothetical protein D9611_010756 [Ephemerocybe angulata]|uniref:Thymidylate synthase/dCMP hydroxymethylase domain-containing protein n=1 Tax=Ephemerocybe angulata TaxID=980116 RepID=A0A8H5F1N2_9AGAR|nr:hypothetical protein D9611_010756 [Tulosesus angulatus]
MTVTGAPHEEHQYLALIRRVLDTGEARPDRTGTGTLALFAPPSLRFTLSHNTLPLLTTKRTFLRGIVEELLWFVRGSTDSKLLSAKGVKIWDGNGSKEFLEGRGLGHRREGDLGPVYGFQWRHFGAEYTDADKDYAGQGVDQLEECIRSMPGFVVEMGGRKTSRARAAFSSPELSRPIHEMTKPTVAFQDHRQPDHHGDRAQAGTRRVVCNTTSTYVVE